MSVLVDHIDRLSQDTADKVTGLFDRHHAGQVDEPNFVRRSAAHVNRANAQATTFADQAVAADLRTQTGKPIRPAGIKPINDQGRLEGAIRKVMGETPKDATTPDEIFGSVRARLGRLARNEPSTAAQNSAQDALRHHVQFLQGWVRALGGSDTCPLCLKWADGIVRSTKVQMNRHHNCRCMPRPVTKKSTKPTGQRIGELLAASPADEILFTSLTGYGGIKAAQRLLTPRFGPSIFDRLNQFEATLARSGIALEKGQYMVHGSGLLDAMNIRVAGDLDVVASPALYDEIAQAPGWRKLQAGVGKDVEILSNRELNVQVVKAVESRAEQLELDLFPELGQQELPFAKTRRQITVDDLRLNTVTLQGREFIKPELLKEMKTAALREGAKVTKNIRDLALLDGNLTWSEDVRRFGDLLNRSRLSAKEERAVAALRHPAAGANREAMLQRAQAAMRRGGAQRRFRPIATVQERRALQKYGKSSFGLNRRLREGVRLSQFEADQVRSIDRALAKQHTPFTVKTYRGLRMSRQEALDLYSDKLGGVPVREESFTSLGLQKTVAKKYASSGVYLEIEVPAGTNGYYAPYRALTSQDLPDAVVNAFGENELLLPRGIPIQYTEIVEESDGTITIRGRVLPTAMPEPPLPGMGIEASVTDLAELDARRLPGTGFGATLSERATQAGAALTDELSAFLDTVQVSAHWATDLVKTAFADLKAHVAELVGRGVDVMKELSGDLVDRFIVKRFGPDFLAQLPGAFTQSFLKSFEHPADRLDFVRRLLAADISPKSTAKDVWGFLKTNPDLAKRLPEAVRAIPETIRVASQPKVRSDLERITENLFGRGAGTRITDSLFGRLRNDPKRLLSLFDDVTRPNPDVLGILRKYRSELSGVVIDASKARITDLGEAIGKSTARTLKGLLNDLRRSERGSFVLPGGREAAPRITAAASYSKRIVRIPGVGPAMGPDLISEANVVKTIVRQATVPGFEDLARRKGRDALDEIMRRQADFIVRSAERSMAFNPAATDMHARWYPFAHGWLNDLADVSTRAVVPVTRAGSYAATAALSPGADWAHNVAWAKRVIEAISNDVVVEESWVQARFDFETELGYAQGRGRGVPRLRLDLVGKHLSEIENNEDVAAVLRGWHDSEPLHQLGGHPGFGDPEFVAVPQSLTNLEKAVSVLRDGSVENIDASLGGQKVRSFYNNLARPLDTEDLDVTIDTHHFGVANGFPWTTSSKWIDTAKGSINLTDTPANAATGAEGTYPLVVEATRRATAILNERWGTHYLPDQIQSIVWEMHRADYPDFVRRGPKFASMNRDIERARTARARGRITPGEEQRLVDVARYRGGAPTDSEILEWFQADAAGVPRRNLVDMRVEKIKARKAAERERKRRARNA